MYLEIKNRIELEIKKYIRSIDKLHSLSSISPFLFKSIKNFVLRKGKRVRPLLFIISYLGFARKTAKGLYRSALSMELLHDFMLVHDDIIDKSETRRGSPSMHAMLNKYLKKHKNIKFSGQDLAIVAGDVMFAMAMHAFLSIQEEKKRKEAALLKLMEAALYTGSGEFIELLNDIKNIGSVKRGDIYKIYDLKTANYTFATPLAAGSILAGASTEQADKLFTYGTYLGRAFQIKDDILGIFGEEKETGKSSLIDLKEGKKTILIWHAYRQSGSKEKNFIKNTLSGKNITKQDLLKMRGIIIKSGALDYAKKEIASLLSRAKAINPSLKMQPKYRNFLDQYSCQILES